MHAMYYETMKKRMCPICTLKFLYFFIAIYVPNTTSHQMLMFSNPLFHIYNPILFMRFFYSYVFSTLCSKRTLIYYY